MFGTTTFESGADRAATVKRQPSRSGQGARVSSRLAAARSRRGHDLTHAQWWCCALEFTKSTGLRPGSLLLLLHHPHTDAEPVFPSRQQCPTSLTSFARTRRHSVGEAHRCPSSIHSSDLFPVAPG